MAGEADGVPEFSAESIVVHDEHDRDSRKDGTLEEGREEVAILDKRVDLVERGIKARGLSDFFELRQRWSTWITRWITGLIVFNGLLAVGVGLKIFNFLQYEWFITAITVETFLQIVGMGYVAVRFLFKDPPQ